jgi:crotonobetainyl-CoA:carnitine CoA-transferase CaiB-like acyl-CoA transferase
MLLADLGADVVRVERPDSGDTFRSTNEAMFAYLNRNKRAVAIDLKTPAGKSVYEKLVVSADVVIDNFAPGVVERLGIAYSDLFEINPRIIYLSLKGFLPGPYGSRPLLDELAQMMGGLAFMTGPPGRPLRAGAAIVDMGGAAYGVIGVLAALVQRGVTGVGQDVKVGLFESVVYWNGQHMADAAATGLASVPFPERAQVDRMTWGVYDLFTTSDERKIFVGVTSDAHWSRFCQSLAFDDLAEDPRLSTNALRSASRDWLIPLLQDRLRDQTALELLTMLGEAEVPFAPVSRPDELGDNPHLNLSGQLLDIVLPHGGHAKLPKPPFTSDKYEFSVDRSAPGLGEHTREVLLEAGISEKEIIELSDHGVIAFGHSFDSGPVDTDDHPD